MRYDCVILQPTCTKPVKWGATVTLMRVVRTSRVALVRVCATLCRGTDRALLAEGPARRLSARGRPQLARLARPRR